MSLADKILDIIAVETVSVPDLMDELGATNHVMQGTLRVLADRGLVLMVDGTLAITDLGLSLVGDRIPDEYVIPKMVHTHSDVMVVGDIDPSLKSELSVLLSQTPIIIPSTTQHTIVVDRQMINPSKQGTTKADLARAAFKEMFGSYSRKQIIDRFIEIGLTVHGAATYYYNCQKEMK